MNMNIESKRQELARRMVSEEVIYCVSSLVSTMSALVQAAPYEVQQDEGISWEEDILPLLETTDYEEAVREFVTENADLDDLEELVNEDGRFDDFVSETIAPNYKLKPDSPDTLCADCHMTIQTGERDPNTSEERNNEIDEAVAEYRAAAIYCGSEFDDEFSTSRCDCCGLTLAGERFMYQEPADMEKEDLQSWLDDDDFPERWDDFRSKVFDYLSERSEFKELCEKYNIDTDEHRSEVYEHWVVTNWLAARLEARGNVTGDLCGLTIWARGCTGQSIALDYPIQEIACQRYEEEYKNFLLTLTDSENKDV